MDRSLFKDITGTPVEKYRIKLIDGPINNETDRWAERQSGGLKLASERAEIIF